MLYFRWVGNIEGICSFQINAGSMTDASYVPLLMVKALIGQTQAMWLCQLMYLIANSKKFLLRELP